MAVYLNYPHRHHLDALSMQPIVHMLRSFYSFSDIVLSLVQLLILLIYKIRKRRLRRIPTYV